MADETVEARLDALETMVASLHSENVELRDALGILQKQAQVKAALAKPAATAGITSSALLRRLDDHGIRVRPEDMDEAQGSGSERWGSATTWAESHDEEAAPV
jgi:hypothetical protein